MPWCNGQRITRLPLSGVPAVTSRRRRTTHTSLAALRRARGAALTSRRRRVIEMRTTCRRSSADESTWLRTRGSGVRISPAALGVLEILPARMNAASHPVHHGKPSIGKSRSSVGRAGDTSSPIIRPVRRAAGMRVIGSSGREFESRRLFPSRSGAYGRWPRAAGHRSSTAIHRARRRRTGSHGPRGRDGAGTRRRDAGANPAGPGSIPL